MKLTLAGFLLARAALFAAGPSGNYSGSLIITTPDGNQDLRATVMIKQAGDTVTVSAGPDADQQAPARNVKLDGDQLTFQVQPPNPGAPPWTFTLKVEQKRLTGTMTATKDGETRTGKVDLAKQ